MYEYKGFSINHDGSYGLYTIKNLGKGAVPKDLKGRFTSQGAAQLAIDGYLKRKG